MKFLVLGCNGMAGHMISLYLKEQKFEVVGFARTKSKYVPSVIGRAEDASKIKKIISTGNFDFVINCIGLLNQAAENNKTQAIYLNSYFPHFLADITSETKTKIIHISTDCVFSGHKGGYVEDDFKDGRSFYDRSKALGELIDNKNITFRNSIIGPDIKSNGIGLMNWFMQQTGEIYGYEKTIWTGQTTLQLAKTIEKAVMENVYGLYNVVPGYPISKYELLKLINHYLRNDTVKIKKTDGIISNKSLKRTNFNFNYIIPDYEIMIRELAEWIIQHKKMYPHYNI